MWKLWTRSQALHCRPSQLLAIDDALAAYCFDGAVTALGLVIETALGERVPALGAKGATVPRYTLAQLLDPAFTLPRPQPTARAQPGGSPRGAPADAPLANLLALAGQPRSGVKRFQYVAPAGKEIA